MQIIYMDLAMSQSLPYDDIKFIGGASISHRDCNKNVTLEEILNTPDDSEIGYFCRM